MLCVCCYRTTSPLVPDSQPNSKGVIVSDTNNNEEQDGNASKQREPLLPTPSILKLNADAGIEKCASAVDGQQPAVVSRDEPSISHSSSTPWPTEYKHSISLATPSVDVIDCKKQRHWTNKSRMQRPSYFGAKFPFFQRSANIAYRNSAHSAYRRYQSTQRRFSTINNSIPLPSFNQPSMTSPFPGESYFDEDSWSRDCYRGRPPSPPWRPEKDEGALPPPWCQDYQRHPDDGPLYRPDEDFGPTHRNYPMQKELKYYESRYCRPQSNYGHFRDEEGMGPFDRRPPIIDDEYHHFYVGQQRWQNEKYFDEKPPFDDIPWSKYRPPTRGRFRGGYRKKTNEMKLRMKWQRMKREYDERRRAAQDSDGDVDRRRSKYRKKSSPDRSSSNRSMSSADTDHRARRTSRVSSVADEAKRPTGGGVERRTVMVKAKVDCHTAPSSSAVSSSVVADSKRAACGGKTGQKPATAGHDKDKTNTDKKHENCSNDVAPHSSGIVECRRERRRQSSCERRDDSSSSNRPDTTSEITRGGPKNRFSCWSRQTRNRSTSRSYTGRSKSRASSNERPPAYKMTAYRRRYQSKLKKVGASRFRRGGRRESDGESTSSSSAESSKSGKLIKRTSIIVKTCAGRADMRRVTLNESTRRRPGNCAASLSSVTGTGKVQKPTTTAALASSHRSPVGSDWSDTDDIPGDENNALVRSNKNN